jgi:hypothetical protein
MNDMADTNLKQPIPDEGYGQSLPKVLLKEADDQREELINAYVELVYPEKRPLRLRSWRDEHLRVTYQMICRYEECGEEFEAKRKDTLFCQGRGRNCRAKRHQDKKALREELNQHWYWVYHQCEVIKRFKAIKIATSLSRRI